jgi:pectate lyase
VALPAIAQYGRCKMTDKPAGFCTLEGGTTGGEGGRQVRVTNVDSLKELMDLNDKLIIEVSGTHDLGGSTTALRSDKTLIGVGDNARIINGGLELYKRNNIIIRNIMFINAPDDLLKVNQNTTHLWVDHCTFTDGDTPDPDGENHDGLFDITRQSNYITISYCLFLNHSKSILIGHSDSYTDDVGYLKTTLHHNWFNGTIQRHPRVRFGEVHCYNNYYLNNELYGVASACEADVVVEGNYFQNVPFPMYVGYAESPDGDLVERNNLFDNSGTPETRGTAFDPKSYYSYTLDPAADVPAIVKANAGAGGIMVTSGMKTPEFNSDIFINTIQGPGGSLTGLAFSIKRPGSVRLTLVNAQGKELAVFHDAHAIPGRRYSMALPGSNLGNGIYFGVLRMGSQCIVKPITYLR